MCHCGLSVLVMMAIAADLIQRERGGSCLQSLRNEVIQ